MLIMLAIAFVFAAVAAAVLIARGIRGGRPMRVGLAIVASPILMLFPASWAGAYSWGTNYWGGVNPLAVLIAWPILTAILYLAFWLWSPSFLVGDLAKTHDNNPL